MSKSVEGTIVRTYELNANPERVYRAFTSKEDFRIGRKKITRSTPEKEARSRWDWNLKAMPSLENFWK